MLTGQALQLGLGVVVKLPNKYLRHDATLS